jgi:hypothetical protein
LDMLLFALSSQAFDKYKYYIIYIFYI